MESTRHSECFRANMTGWYFSGIWPGESPSKYYKYFSIFVVLILLTLYDALLIASLFHTPLEVELIIGEVIFFFNLAAVSMKVATILLWRKEILAVFDILDCDAFKGSDEVGRQIVERNINTYKTVWKGYSIFCNFSFITFCVFPLVTRLLRKDSVEDLPVSKYYFLGDETHSILFVFLYIYQIIGIYVQMMYNVNVDSFLNGLIFFSITQVKLLDHELTSLQWGKRHEKDENGMEQKIQIQALNKYLRHYDLVLQYCSGVQNIISKGLFVQFGMTSATLCVVLCALTLTEYNQVLFMLTYLGGMMSQIFAPGWLGTQLTYQSQRLVVAAYSSDWVLRSEPYKRSLKLFMERANKPIVLTGMQLFPLSLDTFIKITKTAYSFFTLVRNVQDGNV